MHSHETFYEGETLIPKGHSACKLKGGGGTDFRAVFEYVEQNLYDTNLLLYFTDLDGIFPKEEPLYDVVWIASQEGDIPFGKRIDIRSE